MTVSNTNTKDKFITNGVTTVFPFTFYLTTTNQVKAKTIDSNGVETEYTNFTVTINPDGNGGSFTTGDVLNNVDLLVFRQTPQTQETDYVEGGRFPADAHEDALDKLTQQMQEQQEELDRTLKNSIGTDDPVTLEGIFDYIDDADNQLAQDIVTGDAQTLASSIAYTDQQFSQSGQFFVSKSGDTMTGGLNVVDSSDSRSAVRKSTIAAAIDSAINTALGVLPDGTPRDYGFLNEPVDEIIDLGGLN